MRRRALRHLARAEHDGVVPDIMSVAKGLAGGYLPLGAAVYSRARRRADPRVHGGPMTGHTFTGHTAACAAGVAVQRIVERDGLRCDAFATTARCCKPCCAEALGGRRGGRRHSRPRLLHRHRVRRRPRQQGAVSGRAQGLFLRIRRQALANGLICYPVGGNVDGVDGDTVIIAPPYNAS